MSEWELGDQIPLTLYIPAGDLTTVAVLDWVDPVGGTGTVSPAPSTSGSGVDQGRAWTASHLVGQAGTWRFIWTITGAGAGKETSTVYVTSVPPVPWVPTLREVADYIPTRTVPKSGVTATPLMTFTGDTNPSGEQVDRQIRSAVRWVTNRTGTIKLPLYGAARDVAALRAAGMIELSWPERDANLNTARDLLAQAEAALKDLAAANDSSGDTEPGDPTPVLNPVWFMPDPTTTEDIPRTRTSDWGGMKTPPGF